MMSEQQFLWNSLDGGENVFIKERGSDKIIHIKIIEGKYEFVDFMKKVNEQQAIIKRLEEENEQLRKELDSIPKVVLMSEKRFVIDEEGISDNKTDNWYCWKEEVVDLLNEQEQKIQRWKRLYELKDAEVTARVDTLNRVCNYYLTETRFKGDTDPNDAVKEAINEILNAPIYEE